MDDVDPTRIDLVVDEGVDPRTDPMVQIIEGTAIHGNTPFSAVLPAHIIRVFSLYPWERYTVRPGVEVVEVKMYDSSDEPDYDSVLDLARQVHASCQEGPTLVHCQAGLNRSSLIAGAALVLDGYSPEQAIHLLRTRRSPACLCNQTFDRFLRGFRPGGRD